MQIIHIQNMRAEAFAPYGDLIDFDREMDFQINGGMCDRFHDLAKTDISGEGARMGISLARATPYKLPLELKMMERHPLGSQAFIPLQADPFLVIVAEDKDGVPHNPVAFLTAEKQGVNYHRNTWHGVLTPLCAPADFIIVDRIGEGDNLQEFFFDEPYLVRED